MIGFIIALILAICGYKMRHNIYGWYTEIGGNFGGASFGPFAIVSKNPGRNLLNHEFGHSVQNCWFGPLFPFIIAIPSVIRYWYREYIIRNNKNKSKQLPDYDAIWFEGNATKIGKIYFENEVK